MPTCTRHWFSLFLPHLLPHVVRFFSCFLFQRKRLQRVQEDASRFTEIHTIARQTLDFHRARRQVLIDDIENPEVAENVENAMFPQVLSPHTYISQ